VQVQRDATGRTRARQCQLGLNLTRACGRMLSMHLIALTLTGTDALVGS
jgi:hypothetical protein